MLSKCVYCALHTVYCMSNSVSLYTNVQYNIHVHVRVSAAPSVRFVRFNWSWFCCSLWYPLYWSTATVALDSRSSSNTGLTSQPHSCKLEPVYSASSETTGHPEPSRHTVHVVQLHQCCVRVPWNQDTSPDQLLTSLRRVSRVTVYNGVLCVLCFLIHSGLQSYLLDKPQTGVSGRQSAYILWWS